MSPRPDSLGVPVHRRLCLPLRCLVKVPAVRAHSCLESWPLEGQELTGSLRPLPRKPRFSRNPVPPSVPEKVGLVLGGSGCVVAMAAFLTYLCIYCFETGSHAVVQAGLELTMWPRLAWTSGDPPGLSLPSAGIRGMQHLARHSYRFNTLMPCPAWWRVPCDANSREVETGRSL